jgi:hypothetical protein
MQGLMSGPEMSELGIALEEKLVKAQRECLLPNEATKLRPKIQKDS